MSPCSAVSHTPRSSDQKRSAINMDEAGGRGCGNSLHLECSPAPGALVSSARRQATGTCRTAAHLTPLATNSSAFVVTAIPKSRQQQKQRPTPQQGGGEPPAPQVPRTAVECAKRWLTSSHRR